MCIGNLWLRTMSNIPALILAYIRPDGVERLIRALANQGIPRIYISIDGTTSAEDHKRQVQLRAQIQDLREEFQGVEFKIRICKSNLGSGAGVFSGVDWFFENEDSGIILEDDLIIGEKICLYFEKLLTEFALSEDVGMITGTKLFQSSDDYAWTTYPVVWGWATWRDRWLVLRDAVLRDNFKPDPKVMPVAERSYWKIGRRRSLSLAIDAWDIPFAAEFHNRRLKCLILPENQVTNIGLDKQATHEMNDGWPLGIPLGKLTFNPDQNVIDEISSVFSEDSLMRARLYKIAPRHVISNFLGKLRLSVRRKGRDTNAFRRKLEAARFDYE
jgi:hypothetical protein